MIGCKIDPHAFIRHFMRLRLSNRAPTILICALIALPTLAAMLASGCRTPSENAVPARDGAASRQSAVDTSPVAFTNLYPDAAFVGDEACFDCHEKEYRGYRKHGMANSIARLNGDYVVEDIDGSVVVDSTLGYSYTVYEKDGRFFQEEYRLTADGKKIDSQVREMQFVIGSGISARSYLTSEDGWLYQLPITWYTQRKTWDFSPGYRIANKRFDRLILPRCLTCHDAYPEEVPFSDGKYTNVPLGINCERCHGPGGKHVEERLAFPESDSVDVSIVNPAHMPLERRLDVCQQCHLNPTVSLLRQGRTPYDFRPSQDLRDYLALFEVETPETNEEIGLTSHVGRMKASACYRGSLATGKPLECTTCHDPHSGFRDVGPEYFNVTCRNCHGIEALQARLQQSPSSTDHTGSANCISCHMPKADIAKVAHSNFTDHWIRVVDPNEVPARGTVSDPPSLLPIFDGEERGGIYEGLAYVVLGTQQRSPTYLERGARILADSLPDDSDFGEAHFLLGLAYTQLDRTAEAIGPLERAVTLDPNVPERLNALAQAYEAEKRDPVKIGRLYERALVIQPVRSDIRVNYGRFLESRGRTQDAAAAYTKAAEEEPRLASAHYNLGTALLRLGRKEEAEASLKQAITLDPLYAEAWSNLGVLYAGSDRAAEATRAFEQAAEAAPDNPVALGNLGARYLETDDLDRAIPLLERAVDLNPDYVDALVNLSLAYFRNDQFDDARIRAETALKIAPDNALARQILGAL